MKTHLIAFALGALLACFAVLVFTADDNGVQQAKQRTANITEKHKAQRDERRVAEKAFTEKIATIQQKTKSEVKKANTEVEKLRSENEGLRAENMVLHIHIDELNGQLDERERLQAESLAALNASVRTLQIKTAREQAMKIGVGVGVPLLLVGGFIGGFYLAGAVR